MDYKEKYEQALERARKVHTTNVDENKRSTEYIFPELKESEDEKIRKNAIQIIHHLMDGVDVALPLSIYKECISWLEKQGEQTNPYSGVSFEYNGHIWGMCARDNGVDILLDKQLFKHLEKQGEQKPADKVEPKFHKDEWIINKNKKSVYQVIEVKRGVYVIRDNADNHEYYIGIEECEKSGSLWNISDAKDGDVLATRLSPEGDWIGVYKESVDIPGFKTYCFLNATGEFVINPNRCRNHGTHGLHPATKEQYNLLFQKMREAGYEWDSEKKELKKIEQKPAWSEEDEKMLQTAISTIRYALAIPIDKEDDPCYVGTSTISWLKSLKSRMKEE